MMVFLISERRTIIYIEIERINRKREKNGFDLGSPGSYYGKNTN